MLHFRNVGWGLALRKCWLGTDNLQPQTFTGESRATNSFLKAGHKHCESELICEVCAHLHSPFPGEHPWLWQIPIVICGDWGDGSFRCMILIVNTELICEVHAHLCLLFPGIGELARGEAAQCFDPLTSQGFTHVAQGRYPIWGCSGLQQHTCLPTLLQACREQGYTIDRGKDY